MAEEPKSPERPEPQLERGAYEIIRDRLSGQAKRLAQKANALNAQRLELFGRTEFSLLGTERVRTENNCVPRDVVQVGGHLLFGYNVHLGLRTETRVDDVFALHRVVPGEGGLSFEEIRSGGERAFLDDPQFVKEFRELYQYYKSARLVQLRQVEGKLLAAFQIGAAVRDIKVFRWEVGVDRSVRYIDNRGERDHTFPPSHDFEWSPTGRESYVEGRHPHVSILDEVFVEAVGGDLTVKIENNTEDGLGIYSEPVEDPRQALDDAEIQYAKVGSLILIKVLPFRERAHRYLVYNGLTQKVARLDAVGQSCLQLPEDHGIVFPGGYHLQSGETKVFDGDYAGLEFQRSIRSPNGEDVLYVFHHRIEGRSVLFPYNLIRKEVTAPVACHGFSLFDDGKLVILRAASEEPTRVHPLQTWQTPFCSEEHAAAQPQSASYLAKIGNADLVRGISDCLSLARMAEQQQPTRAVYQDLIASSIRVLDAYYWLDRTEAGGLGESVGQVRKTAEQIIDEFDKVEAIRRTADGKLREAENDLRELFRGLRPQDWDSVPPFVDALAELRRKRGHLITLRDLRYVDRKHLDALEAQVVERFAEVSDKAVGFLVTDEALAPYHAGIAELERKNEQVTTVHEAQPLRQELDRLAGNLDLLAEVVSGLEIDDATVRTRILEGISEVVGGLNRARALVEAKRRELLSGESVAEFGVQFKLFSQSVTSALGGADTPEKCETALSKLMLQLEELEGRFSEFDEFLAQLATKREEVYEAASSKKQLLLDQRQRRADTLMEAAERILANVGRRSSSFADEDELNAYFAGDPMVAKLRDLGERLRELGAGVRADEIESRVKAAHKDAARSLRDRTDLYEEGTAVIRLGRHRFSVNSQSLDLTLVPRGDGVALHLTGTEFHEPFADPEFEKTKAYWRQELVSETPEVYRGEYLAACLLADAEEERSGLGLAALHDAARAEGGLVELVRRYAAERYDEGYERGVHDVDAARILEKLLALYSTAGLLRFEPRARALAMTFWAFCDDKEPRASWERRAKSLARLRAAFAHSPAIATLAAELGEAVAAFFEARRIPVDREQSRIAGAYLFEELAGDPVRFQVSAQAVQLRDAFLQQLAADGSGRELEHDVKQLGADLARAYPLVHAWLSAFVQKTGPGRPEIAALAPVLDNAVALILAEDRVAWDTSSALPAVDVEGLLGQHARIQARKLHLRLDEFTARLARFRNERVPGFQAFQKLRHQVLERERRRLRLSEYQPRVMSAFVRNKLIDQVYLPLIGDNLAKQIGALGEGKRTDLMGMLLLISPPGYGKTTLMEYVANRLGLVFMKINGPSLGHAVTSLDPAEAKSATARQEVEKINLAFEMASNVLLYIDDIQHTHPELLQKFISLCDAQRKVEGVWKGETRTYDLKGRRFIVCMAGNPYTESGEKFQVPDMLANRADIYNLGDVLHGREELFATSYLENALTSNPALSPLSARAPEDVYRLIGMARGDGTTPDQLAHSYSVPELEEILGVLKRLIRVQQVLLKVNQQYILSASQQDAFRTEPPFQLQGSYRNMNKLAEKIAAVMNDDELEALVDDHYLGESQTLTTGAEQNLLKLAEMRGRMSDEQTKRWEEIKRSYARIQTMGGAEEDPAVRIAGQLGLMSERLGDIGARIAAASAGADGGSPRGESAELAAALAPALERLGQTLATVTAPKETGLSPEAVNAIGAHLGQVSEGLGRIGDAIASAAEAGARARGEGPELQPYLEKLHETVEAMSKKGGTRREIVQTLPGGVQDLLDELVHQVADNMMPSIRGLARRIEGSEDAADRRFRDQLASALKQLDQLRDLVGALRKLDTRGLDKGPGAG
jgi:hypothetical protein